MRQRSRVTRTTATLASTAMLAAGLIALAPQAAQAAPGSKTFNTSGGLNQNWNVPNDVHSLTITAKGAAGGAGGLEGGSGGRGASGSVTVPVTPGQLITVYLGQRGTDAHTDSPFIEGAGGNSAGTADGGAGGEAAFGGGAGGGGGGASEVFVGAASDDTRAIVAGGGGGGGGNNGPNEHGGNGGGGDEDGQNGTLPESEGGHPGDAPTQAGGIGDSANGFLTGGGAGGGGGGFQGGSQGATFLSSSGAGGGGGRSYVNPLFGTLDNPWANTSEGNGSVVITYNQAFTSTTTIADPGLTVTQELKRYDVHVAGNGGQTPKGKVTLIAENNGTGAITGYGEQTLDAAGNVKFFADLDAEKLKVGGYTLTAEFTPTPGSDSLASSDTQALTVSKGNTSTLISAPLDPADLGDDVTLGVTVTPQDPAGGVPSGKVQFFAAGNPLDNPVTLDALGQAQLITNRLEVGSYPITAQYAGDKEFNNSASNIIDFVVNKGGVSIDLTSVHNPVLAGEKSKFEAVVKSTKSTKKPTGTVQFFNNGDPLGGPVAVNPLTGLAALDYVLPVTDPDGHHHVTAVYSGDGNFNDAISNYIDQIVNFGSAKVKLTSDINPSKAGENVTFSVDVDGNLPTSDEPTGEVQLYVNGTAFNSPKVIDIDGKVTFDSDDLPVGDNNVTARYLGDDNYKEAESAPLIQVVQLQNVEVLLTASDTDLQYGETLTLTTEVFPDDGSEPTGTVTFLDNGAEIGEVNVDANGGAVLEIKKPTKGVHQYGATYSGDEKNGEGTSNTVQVTVRKNTVKILVATSGLPAYEKQDIRLHARIDGVGSSAGKIEGIIQWYSNSKKVGGSIPVSGTGGGTRVIHGGFKPGSHRLVAKFIPKTQSLYEIAVSDTVIQKVRKGKPNAKINESVRRTSIDEGKVNVSVRRSSGKAASGKVRIYLDGKPFKTLSLSGGKATTYVTGLPDRGVLVSASYLGKGSLKPVSTEKGMERF